MGAWIKAGDMWIDLSEVYAVKRLRITHRGVRGEVATEAAAVLYLRRPDGDQDQRVTVGGEDAQAVYDVMDALVAGTLEAALEARRQALRQVRLEDDDLVIPMPPPGGATGTTGNGRHG